MRDILFDGSRELVLQPGEERQSDVIGMDIHAGDTLWFQPVPRQEHLYVWGPQYRHPVWHNEGDALQLMPTITEYWEPVSGDSTQEVQQLVEKINRDGYYLTARTNDLRITFMRGLHPGTDTTYVFLGHLRHRHHEG